MRPQQHQNQCNDGDTTKFQDSSIESHLLLSPPPPPAQQLKRSVVSNTPVEMLRLRLTLTSLRQTTIVSSCCCWFRRLHLVTAKRWVLVIVMLTLCGVVVYNSGSSRGSANSRGHAGSSLILGGGSRGSGGGGASGNPIIGPLYGLIRSRPQSNYKCPTSPQSSNVYYSSSSSYSRTPVVDHAIVSSNYKIKQLRIDPKVLLFVENNYSKLGKDVAELLVHNRMKYKLELSTSTRSLPTMTNGEKGRFSTIVFENYTRYLYMDKWNRELLDKYCREFNVGILGFMPANDETFVGAQVRNASLYVDTNVRVKDAYLNPHSPVLRLTRSGGIVSGTLPSDPNDFWTVFSPNHSTYEAVSYATSAWQIDGTSGFSTSGDGTVNSNSSPLVTVIQDKGQEDGIRRVLFGAGLKFWLNKLLFLDSLSYLSRGRLSVSLKRYLLIDIDDIFVGEKGTRLKRSDVEAMLEIQDRIRNLVPGFRFNLGYSGKYFHNGDDEENEGDDLLLQNTDKFMWFPHMWNHIQPHLYSNLTQLVADMIKNKEFAKEKGIPLDSGYSVSPHHSGVYPVHELLYDAWKKVWNIKVTSTEEYPHLRPARLRRGFIHRGVMVLPRQTCGLFTHTIFIDRYPGGESKLEESIWGGELFQTIIFNTINVFMTHMSNYGNDRLGLYTFESVLKFVQCWTNVQMVTLPPVLLAEKYFKMHTDELDPIWGNPCDDPRHRKIWSSNKTCDSLPQFLVIGPQKTGTTALYTFLSMHPSISSNRPSPETFEEVQFFNGKNYYRGLDWYSRFFVGESSLDISGGVNISSSSSTVISASSSNNTVNSNNNNNSKPILFEKSATYFDNELVPKRAHALLPKAKIVTILISPSKRAYSWYQHMRGHNDAVAMNHTFYEVLTAGVGAPKVLRDLRNRCLNPGRYAQHLERWLSYYSPQQLMIVDGDELRNDPVSIMDRLQRFLAIGPVFDYSTRLRYDKKKGFYCQVISQNKNKCLGRSKGRNYPPMDAKSAKYLKAYYTSHNNALVKLLRRLDQPVPQWLKDDLVQWQQQHHPQHHGNSNNLHTSGNS